MCQLLFPPWPNWSYLTKFGQMVSTLKCILQVSISCFFLMVEFPISPGALEGKLFHPTLIQVLWPICLKKSQLISSSWLHSVNSKGTISITRERENKHQKCTVLGVSCENTECTKSCLVHVQKQQWLRHIFSSFRFRMTKRRLRKN